MSDGSRWIGWVVLSLLAIAACGSDDAPGGPTGGSGSSGGAGTNGGGARLGGPLHGCASDGICQSVRGPVAAADLAAFDETCKKAGAETFEDKDCAYVDDTCCVTTKGGVRTSTCRRGTGRDLAAEEASCVSGGGEWWTNVTYRVACYDEKTHRCLGYGSAIDEAQCLPAGAKLVDRCPSENLLGCCGGGLLSCDYQGASKTAAELEKECLAFDSHWSTSVPKNATPAK